MTDEQFEKLYNQKNSLNSIPKWTGVIAAIAGIVFGYATLSSNVANNSKEIERLNNEISDSITEIKSTLSSQSERFELYLDSLRNTRNDFQDSDSIIEQQVDDIEDRLIIIESQL